MSAHHPNAAEAAEVRPLETDANINGRANGYTYRGQRTVLSVPIIRNINQHADFIAVHPEALALLAPTEGNLKHVARARETGQSEIIIVRFHKGLTRKQVFEVVDQVYDMRQHARPSEDKVDAIARKGYLLISEEQLVRAIHTFTPNLVLKPTAKALSAAD